MDCDWLNASIIDSIHVLPTIPYYSAFTRHVSILSQNERSEKSKSLLSGVDAVNDLRWRSY